MPRKPPTLAKLSKPRLHKAVARERLLTLLDQKREHPAVWIAAPPGAGKTTLAANYVDEAKANAVWFQIDAGDSDPATFFYYLKQAIEQKGRRKAKPLQLFTPEYRADMTGFARRFFRDVFPSLSDDALLVFDNYHEIDPQSPLHDGFAAALSEIPPGANILILSRADPPASFAQAILNQTISSVSWEDIKLTADEATDIANARGITDTSIINELQRKTDGWVAGLTLMLEHTRAGGEILGAARPEMLETVSDYFAHVIFETSSPEAQDVLLKTALLPRVTPELAEAVTGNKKAIEHVRALHRRHLFVGRTPGEVATYQYHAMFHGFLRSRARATLPGDDIRAIHATAAQTLEKNNDLEGGFSMCASANAWDRAERLLIDHAAELISQGRWRTLQQWVRSLPKKRAEKNPWVRYWLGLSLIWIEPAAVQPSLQIAYKQFLESGNQVGQALTAVGILETLVYDWNYRKYHELDAWIGRLSTLMDNGVSFETPEDELRMFSALVSSACARAPNHPQLLGWIRRMPSLVGRISDPNVKLAAAATLLRCAYIVADESVVAVATSIAEPNLSSPLVLPLVASSYQLSVGYAHYTFGRYTDALECFEHADIIATENGLLGPRQRVAYLRTLFARRAGLHDLAIQSAELFSTLRESARVSGNTSLEFLRAVLAFDRGDYRNAISSALAVDEEMKEDADWLSTVTIRTVCANVLAGSGKPDDARHLLELARAMAVGANTSHFLGAIALNEAWVEHLLGNDAKRDKSLREAFVWARDKRGRIRFDWFKNTLEDLLPVAIERNIEPDLALQLARGLKIIPRDTSLENWPWPVKVYTLGDFRLLIDNQPPSYSRKIPKKALALLKAIITFGGERVPEQKLIDALWPDTEGDASQRALSATVHRLRKLLRHSGAVRQSGGALSLDERLCWVDAFAFENQIGGNGDRAALECALTLYRGAFLGDEDDSPWLAPYREHLRSRFTDAIGKLGNSLQEDSRDEEAIALYSRGIEADNLVEPFYQGLMRCHERLGQRVEAINAYRRLRDILSITLGVEPSPRSRQLVDALRQA